MTTTGPGLTRLQRLQRGKPQVEREVERQQRASRVSLREDTFVDDALTEYPDDDPTDYPDGEPMGRETTETVIVLNLDPVIRRYQAERGIVCFVGADNFIYWVKGDNKACVSPDIYILPGLSPKAHPKYFQGSKDDGCWKTWIHGVVPNFAIEVKAASNPRKDELQSPARHDALGTKELIVFDPFIKRRRASRKRFCVWRRNAAGKLVVVLGTNDDRVYSEVLDAYVVAEGEDGLSLLRLGLGPNGDQLLPFESERVDMEARRADEAVQRADEEARLRQEQAHRADEATHRADEATHFAQVTAQRNAELEAELALLRAAMVERPKRRSKSEK